MAYRYVCTVQEIKKPIRCRNPKSGYNRSTLSGAFLVDYEGERGRLMLEGWFLWFILLWMVVMVGSFAIGGFFMFRKFLKKLPKQDGKSDLDWEEFYVQKTIH